MVESNSDRQELVPAEDMNEEGDDDIIDFLGQDKLPSFTFSSQRRTKSDRRDGKSIER